MNHARIVVFGYIETFYCAVIIHGSSGSLLPSEYEKRYYSKSKLEQEKQFILEKNFYLTCPISWHSVSVEVLIRYLVWFQILKIVFIMIVNREIKQTTKINLKYNEFSFVSFF